MKTCSKCTIRKPLSDFYNCRTTRDGKQARCKPCQNELAIQWRASHPEAAKVIDKRHRTKRREVRNSNHRAYYYANRERMKADASASYYAVKDEVFKAYGGYVCACCGETEKLFLSIDHVNGDGNLHRKTIGARSIYQWLKAHNFPKGFQILCFNCNQGKRLNNNVCPHRASGESKLFIK